MKFRTRYTEMETVYSEKGNPVKDVLELCMDDDGRKVIKCVGQTDLNAAIQAEYPSVNLDLILARFAAGDATALERAKGFYADISELPVKLQDVMNLNYEAEKFFKSLPSEIRDVFGNDYMQFIYDPGRLVDVLNSDSDVNTVDEKIKEEKVVENGEQEQ